MLPPDLKPFVYFFLLTLYLDSESHLRELQRFASVAWKVKAIYNKICFAIFRIFLYGKDSTGITEKYNNYSRNLS